MLNHQNTVVLVVDIQERLLPVLHQSAEFAAACRRWIMGSQYLSLPIILTEQYPKGLGKTVADVAVLLNNVPVFEKTRFSAFTEEVQAALAQHKPQNVILIGCEAHICVLQTAWDLRGQGFEVYVPQECVTSRTAANKQNGIDQMREAGVHISNIESLLFQMLQDAQHPQFKNISKLIA